MIPKVIHYCWFGNGKKSELVLKCIESWKKYCPNYKIIEWNETNYDVTKNKYMREAYEEKRWGFVSDYARLDIVAENGGIYLDTDVELISNLDDFLDCLSYFGFERAADNYYINTGSGFGSIANNPFLFGLRDSYNSISFRNEEGILQLTPCPIVNANYFSEYGFKMDNTYQNINGNVIYPSEYFSPISWSNMRGKYTEKTVSIHHYDTSWLSEEEKKKRRRATIKHNIIHFPNSVMKTLLGKKRYEELKLKLKGDTVCRSYKR